MPVSLVHYNSIRPADSQYTDDGNRRSVGPPYVMKVKAKAFLGGVVTVIIRLGTRREGVVSFTSRSLYYHGNRPGAY
jgi:hypothetical protein